MDFSADDLYKGRWNKETKKYDIIFRYFIGNPEAYTYGRTKDRDANREAIANRAYGTRLGNRGIDSDDGWNFRGKGLIQLTGRDAYTYANTYTKKEGADIVNNPDLVLSDINISVISSMAFWKWKKLNIKANETTNVVRDICPSVGKNVKLANGKTNYGEKQKAFNEKTSVVFKINECTWGKQKDAAENGDINKYKIEIDKFTYPKILNSSTSKKYQYDIYDSGTLIKTFVLEKNSYNLLPFPESGPNWGRFGIREKGGDNWADEKVTAALLGFFYSLPKNGFSEILYFNDISANDKRNIEHTGHRKGDDIDIRYPGSANKAGEVLWREAMKVYSDEKKFVEVLENILSIAFKWKFNKNYAYKTSIKNTTGNSKTEKIHQNHFHLGLR